MLGPPRRTVLVVEDDAAIRERLRLHLDLSGFAIDEAADGRTALDRASEGESDKRGPADVVPPPVLDAGELTLDRQRRTVRGDRIELTRQEFDLLYLMASRPGAMFTRTRSRALSFHDPDKHSRHLGVNVKAHKGGRHWATQDRDNSAGGRRLAR